MTPSSGDEVANSTPPEAIMTAEAHALLANLDSILADALHLGNQLAITGAAHATRESHGKVAVRMIEFRGDLAKALEPKAEAPVGDVPDHWKNPPVITAISNKPAMWSARPDAESTPVAAEAVADAPAEAAE